MANAQGTQQQGHGRGLTALIIGLVVALAIAGIVIAWFVQKDSTNGVGSTPLIQLSAPKTSTDFANNMESNLLQSASDAASTASAAQNEKAGADAALAKVKQLGFQLGPNAQGQPTITPPTMVPTATPPQAIIVNVPGSSAPVLPLSHVPAQPMTVLPGTPISVPPALAPAFSVTPGTGTLNGGSSQSFVANQHGQLVPVN